MSRREKCCVDGQKNSIERRVPVRYRFLAERGLASDLLVSFRGFFTVVFKADRQQLTSPCQMPTAEAIVLVLKQYCEQSGAHCIAFFGLDYVAPTTHFLIG